MAAAKPGSPLIGIHRRGCFRLGLLILLWGILWGILTSNPLSRSLKKLSRNGSSGEKSIKPHEGTRN